MQPPRPATIDELLDVTLAALAAWGLELQPWQVGVVRAGIAQQQATSADQVDRRRSQFLEQTGEPDGIAAAELADLRSRQAARARRDAEQRRLLGIMRGRRT